ncbi:MAG: SNF2-related protein [Candidatus Muirbacterium halophilum]|nr:SNF2-related protein [Candidatus Muirbacterium halophilum]MCK9477340.1 SNF2-related protein [Candidatus Muirbacterium halophilum]
MIINNKTTKVINKLRDKIEKKSQLFIVTDIFTIYAFYELLNKIEIIESVNILLTNSFERTEDNKISHFEDILMHRDEITYRNSFLQSEVSKKIFDLIKQKIHIKKIQPELNDIKTNIILLKNPSGKNYLVSGSSNFTTTGLGLNYSNSIGLITDSDNNEEFEGYYNWFIDIWEEDKKTINIRQEISDYIKLGFIQNSPETIYYKILYSLFGNEKHEMNEDKIIKTKTGIKETEIWKKLYKFQKDAVLGAIDKIEKYNGCIIADSVGLGKTFEALAIIKYYELRNDRVLVLAPKRLRENWTVFTLNDKRNILYQDKFNFDVLNHTDLTRENGMSGDINLQTIHWENYDLVVIDESHNFRNNNARKGSVTRYQRLMNDIISEGVDTKVLMLSATPVNNKMNDLKNQIAFITKGNDNAFDEFEMPSYENVLKNAQRSFNKWLDLPGEVRTIDIFVDMTHTDYFRLLDLLTIARSRKHIEKYYNIEEIGVFPERLLPENIKSDIDIEQEFPPLRDIDKKIKRLNLAMYSPLKYVMNDKKQIYAEKYDIEVKGGKSVLTQLDREKSLINLMRMNILKRMESSIFSFMTTCEGLLKTLEHILHKIEEFHNADEYIEEVSILDIDLEDEEFDTLLIGGKVKVLLHDLDIIKYKQELQEDRDFLTQLIYEAKKINNERDAKLRDLKKVIKNKIENPVNDENRKILIFSAFATTANYLYDNLKDWLQSEYNINSALVVGTGANKTNANIKKKDLHTILTLFSPISKEKNKVMNDIDEQIDIVFATDCISEGQNLQDCDCLINYDIHWNPVRIIQRFGRIDRLGSKNQKIKLINFWPNMELDEYINLEARVSGKMVLLDVSATGEENLIVIDGKKMNDLEYRRNQLEKLQEKVVDLEEMVGGISILDMTFNDFKMDLMEHLKNTDKYYELPNNIFTITESKEDEIQKGCIFCLKKRTRKDITQLNSLFPYFLIYVTDEGEIKYSFSNSRRILDIIKKQCVGNKIPNLELYNEIEKQTNHYKEMDKYYRLFSNAISKITGEEQEKGMASLFAEGETLDFFEISENEKDFEIVSFLIIKEKN